MGELNTKQAAITAEDVKANQKPKRFKVAGFVGSYHSYHFNDNGEVDRPMDEATLNAFRQQWPKAKIEWLD